jgi:membrane protease YdiL (CAAX protease family)
MENKSIIAIITFFALAFGWSFWSSQMPSIPFYTIDVKELLCGIGPLLSGLCCFFLFKTPSDYSIDGQQIKVWFIVGIVGLTFVLTNKAKEMSYTILLAISQIVYCLGEEYGWRNYLQAATNSFNRWVQPFLIGIIWFAWHFAWLDAPLKAMLGDGFNAPLGVGIVMGILSLSLFSMFLGWIMQKTKTLMFPVLIHFAIKTNTPTLLVTLGLIFLAITLESLNKRPS